MSSITAVAVALLTASVGPTAAQAASPKPAPKPARVLLLHSYGQHFSPWNHISARFRTELVRQSPRPIELYEASLQPVRADEARARQAFLGYLRSLFPERDPDLVVAIGAPATRFFQEYRSQIFPSAPLLITATDVRTYRADAFSPSDTAVAVSLDLPANIENILQLLPDTKTIAVVIGDSPLERFWVEELRREFARFGNRVTIEYLNKLSFDEIARRVAELPAHSVVFYASVRLDAHGIPQEDDRVFSHLREVSNSPIFSYEDHTFGRGAVGGPLSRLEELGDRAVAVALRMLNGERGGDIKIPVIGPGPPIYDWRELQRWGIDERRLPAGSEIRFRQPSLWEQYRWQISLAAGLILLQTALIAGLFYEHWRRQAAERSARNSLAELAHVNRLATAGQLATSIAHEVSQPLTALVAHAQAGLRWLGGATPRIGEARTALQGIVEAGQYAGEVIHDIRAFVKKGAPRNSSIDVNDIIRGVLSLAAADLRKRDIRVLTTLADEPMPILGDEVQLKQVLLNLISNAADAMAAVTDRPRTLHIASDRDPGGGVVVRVEDSGPGIAPQDLERIFTPFHTTKAEGMGMGLSISRSIVEAHQGRLWASTGAPFGAVLQLALPAAGSRGPAERAAPSVTQGADTAALI